MDDEHPGTQETPEPPKRVSRRAVVKGLGLTAAASAAGAADLIAGPGRAVADPGNPTESAAPRYQGSFSKQTWGPKAVQAFDGVTYEGRVYQANAATTSPPGGAEWTPVTAKVAGERTNWTEWNQTFQANVFMHGPHPYVDVCAPPFNCVGDNHTDNTAGLQAAIDYCTNAAFDNVGGLDSTSIGARIFLGVGFYLVTGTLLWGGHDGANGYGIEIQGSGRSRTLIGQSSGHGEAYHLLDTTKATFNKSSALRDLELQGAFSSLAPNTTATLASPLQPGQAIDSLTWTAGSATRVPQLPAGTVVQVGNQTFGVASTVDAGQATVGIIPARVSARAGGGTDAKIFTAGDGLHGGTDGWLVENVSISGFRHGLYNTGNYVSWIRGLDVSGSAGYGYWGHNCFDSRYSDWWLTSNRLGNVRMDNPSEMRLSGMELEEVSEGPMLALYGGSGVSLHMISFGRSLGSSIVVDGCGGVGIYDVDLLATARDVTDNKPAPPQAGIHLKNTNEIAISGVKLGQGNTFGDQGVIRVEADCTNVVISNCALHTDTQWTSEHPIVDLASDTVISGVNRNPNKAPFRYFATSETKGTSLAHTQEQLDLVVRALQANGMLFAIPGMDPVRARGVVSVVEARTLPPGQPTYTKLADRISHGPGLTTVGAGAHFHKRTLPGTTAPLGATGFGYLDNTAPGAKNFSAQVQAVGGPWSLIAAVRPVRHGDYPIIFVGSNACNVKTQFGEPYVTDGRRDFSNVGSPNAWPPSQVEKAYVLSMYAPSDGGPLVVRFDGTTQSGSDPNITAAEGPTSFGFGAVQFSGLVFARADLFTQSDEGAAIEQWLGFWAGLS